MSPRSDRARLAAARRAERDGSGPVVGERAAGRWPGARGAFAFLGEVLLVGILVAVCAIPIVTLPAALAAGVRHLRRYAHGEDSALVGFWRELRIALPGGSAVGAVALLAVLVLVLDLDLAGSGALPGGPAIAVVGWLGLAAVALVLMLAAGAWSPELRWRGALRSVPGALRDDVRGALYLVATAAFAYVVTWQLVPLVLPALGCVALAIVAVPERARRAAGARG